MTITTQVSVATTQGDGVTTSFAWAFLIATTASLRATLYDATVDPVTIVDLDRKEFTILHGIGDPEGGEIRYPLSGTPISAGLFVSIYRDEPLVQDATITPAPAFFPSAVEGALDTSIEAMQDIATTIREIQEVVGGLARAPVFLFRPDLVVSLLEADTLTTEDLFAVSATFTTASFGVYSQEGFTPVDVGDGATVTLSGAVSFTALNLTAAIAALTVHLPPAPVHGQVAGFSIDNPVSVLTVSGNGHTIQNAPLPFQKGGTGFTWCYHGPSATWWKRAGPPNLANVAYVTTSFVFNFGSIGTSDSAFTTTTVTGAIAGSYVIMGMPCIGSAASVDAVRQTCFTGQITADNVGLVIANNLDNSPVNPTSSQAYRMLVLPTAQFV